MRGPRTVDRLVALAVTLVTVVPTLFPVRHWRVVVLALLASVPSCGGAGRRAPVRVALVVGWR